MIRIEGTLLVAATLAAELKFTKTVENATRFCNSECGQACLPVPQQRSRPACHGRMHKSALSGKGEKKLPQGRSDKFLVIVDGSRPLSWDVTLMPAIGSALMNAAAGLVPDSSRQKRFMLRVMAFTARYVLATGKRNLAGRTPNGQEFITNPQQVWLVGSSLAVVNGRLRYRS